MTTAGIANYVCKFSPPAVSTTDAWRGVVFSELPNVRETPSPTSVGRARLAPPRLCARPLPIEDTRMHALGVAAWLALVTGIYVFVPTDAGALSGSIGVLPVGRAVSGDDGGGRSQRQRSRMPQRRCPAFSRRRFMWPLPRPEGRHSERLMRGARERSVLKNRSEASGYSHRRKRSEGTP